MRGTVACATPMLSAPAVNVEVDVGSASSWGRRPDRLWLVRLRRGDRCVVVAIGLSRVAAEHVAGRLSELLEPVAAERARSPGR